MIKKLRRQFIIIAMASMGAVLALIIFVINITNYNSMMNTVKQRMTIVLDMVDGDMPPFGGNGDPVEDASDTGLNDTSTAEEPDSTDATVNNRSNADSTDATSINSTNTDTSGESSTNSDSSAVSASNSMDSNTAIQKNMQSGAAGTKDFKMDKRGPGVLSGQINNETRFDTRYFVVTYDSDGNYFSSDVSRIASVDSDSANAYASEAVDKNKSDGIIDGFYFESNTDSDGSTSYIFLDISRELSSFRTYLFISILTSAVGALAVYILILIFSRRVMKPVAESYEKQKRFITDASHEIKTPLAIIGANTEVIEMESGENEWTKSINHQIKRLSSLVEKMVFLSKMDEEGSALQMIDFNASDAVSETADSFDAIAESKGFSYEKNIEDNLMYFGDKERVVQLASLLLDNAMKYCSENGKIKVSLTKGRKKGLVLSVFNTCDSIEKGNNDILFERFYRADKSRNSKTGGHGIGLSVVRAIAEAHHGEAHAFSEDGKSITFTIKLN